MTRGRALLLAALVSLGVSASPCRAETVDADEVANVLADRPWVTIDGPDHVKFGADWWKGPADLSFRYRLRVRNGTLYLWVDVTDDVPRVVGKAPFVFDHVEMWLADPTLAATYAARIDGVKETAQRFQERVEEHDECEPAVRDFLATQRNLVEKLGRDRYFAQLVFPYDDEGRAPGEPSAAGSGAWLYRFHERGFEFFARLPLYLVVDLAREDVDRLGVLVDVVDVDDPASSRQKTLVSSSASRRFGDPSSFETVTLDEPYRIPLSSCERALATIYDDGFWRRADGRYERVRWGHQAWSGCFGVDRDVVPGNWERLPPSVAFPPDFTMRLSSNGARGVLSLGDRCTSVELAETGTALGGSEWTPRFSTVDGGYTYLLVEGRAYSRYPPGPTWCGAGVEAELLWLKLDGSLAVVGRDTARTESCVDTIEDELHQIGDHRLVIVSAQRTGGNVTSRMRITYDARRPAAGLVKEAMEAGER